MSGKRVLIVDDEQLTRISLSDFLEELGYDSVVAGDGKTAIELQTERPFDVCVVDIRMPGIDGMQVILALHQIAPRSRFIVYTGSPRFYLPPALMEIGISEQEVVFKPVLDMYVFVPLIERLVGETDLRIS